MMTKQQIEIRRAQTCDRLERIGVVLTEAERHGIKIADFGLNAFEQVGLACWCTLTAAVVVPRNW